MVTRSKARKPNYSRAPKRRPSRKQANLKFESLEHRQLLAGVTVGNTTDLVNAPDLSSISALVADDGGDGVSLREAITAANNTSGADTVTFDATVFGSPQSIALGTTLPTISDELTVTGPTALLTIDAGNGTDGNFGTGDGFQILSIDDGNGSQIDVNISDLRLIGADDGTNSGGAIFNAENLTLTNVQLTGNAANFGGGITNAGTASIVGSTITGNDANVSGGGILNSGVINVTDSEVSNNTADFGGGVANNSAATFNGSTIAENNAKFSGGIENAFGGTVTLTNSTISTNTATDGAAGGIGNLGSNGAGTTSLIINNSTITGNQSTNNPSAAGIENLNGAAAASATINNSIVADPVSSDGTLTGDFNLFGVSGATTGGSNDVTGVNDPMLGPLQSNGGPTRTHAPLDGSPAIDSGNSALATDQRGFNRPVDLPNAVNVANAADIGAFERQELPGLIVTTANDVVLDDGVTSLREAISFANSQAGADTITFDASLTGQTIHQAVALGSWEILDSLTIDGDINDDGIAAITVDADSAAGLNDADNAVFRIFGSNLQTTMDGLIIRDGNSLAGNGAGSGGGIQVGNGAGDLTLLNTIVLDNSASQDGGAIHIPNGQLTLTSSTISGNSAGDDGGGIYAKNGSITLTNSTVSGNTANRHGGGIRFISGAITLTNSTVSGNSAGWSGGGILTEAGAITLTNSTVSGNSAGWSGGGIQTSSSAITLTNSTVSGNTANLDGGGIRTSFGAITLTNSTVSGNTARDGGGIRTGSSVGSGAITLTNSTVSGNTARYNGGGIRSISGEVTLSGSTITGNSATRGGGIYVRDTNANPAFVVSNSIVAGNSATISGPDLQPDPDSPLTVDFSLIGDTTDSGIDVNTGTGNVLNVDPMLGPLADNGGPTQTHALLVGSPAIDAGNSALATDQRGVVRPLDNPNVADAAGGNGADMGAVEQTEFPSLVVTTASDVVDATDFVTSLREAINFANSQVGDDTITFDAGLTGQTIHQAVALESWEILDSLTIDGDINDDGIADITVDADSAAGLNDADNAVFRIFGSNLQTTMDGLIIRDGNSLSSNGAGFGGGIQVGNGAGDLTLLNSSVLDNSASEQGGGIHFPNGQLTLTSSTISGNTSNRPGGGIWTSSGAITLTNGTVSGNTANIHGGGIYTLLGPVTLTNSTVSGNTSNSLGGGIWTSSGAITLTNSTVSGNTTDIGGGIFTQSAAITLTNSTISENTANDDGGGIWADSGEVTLSGSTITGNSAARGGGVFGDDAFSSPAFAVSNSIVAGNTATNSGPDLQRDPDSPLTVDFSLIGDTTDSGIDVNTGTGNVLNVDPMLGPLAENGGPTQTHALLVGSPAIDSGNSTLATDQRGVVRPLDHPNVANAAGGNGADMGAVEQTEFPSLVVTTASDVVDATDFVTSLREAIDLANNQAGADTITFATELSGQTIPLNGSQLSIGESLTIDASSLTDNVTVDAGQNSRVMLIHGGPGNFTLNNLKLTGGRATGIGSGGGIAFTTSSGHLWLIDSVVTGNSTQGNGHGGGIYTSDGNLSLTRSAVTDNNAVGTSGFGGGITAARGDVHMTDSTISGNSTVGAVGGVFAAYGNVTLTSSTISGNTTNEVAGGIASISGIVSLTNSTVSGNTSGSDGGGIWVFDGSVALTNSTVSGNSSTGIGGGISIDPYGSSATEQLTLSNSIVAGNSDNGTAPDFLAPGGGTNQLAIDFSLIGDNAGTTLAEAQTADANGNLIGSTAGAGNIDALLAPLSDNGGTTQTHALLPGSPAIDAGNSMLTNDQRGVVRPLDNPNVANAAGGNGADMGAVEQTEFPSLVVTTASDVVDATDFVTSLREAINFANSQVGADTITFDAGVFTGSAASLIRLDGTELEITDSLTIDASAGGAVDVTITGDALGDDTVLPGFITDLTQTAASELDDNSRVLNFTSLSGDLTLNALTITGGRTTGVNLYGENTYSGGGIRFNSDGILALDGGSVSGNQTTGPRADGGGIHANNGAVTLTGSTVSGNETTGYITGSGHGGGGISTHSGTITLTDSTIIGNTASGNAADGGGIGTISGAIVLTNSTVSGNTANDDGGGIRTSSGAITLTNSTVSGNTANDDGGGIRTSSGAITLTNSTVSGNTANQDGGGIRGFDGLITLTNSSVSENTATRDGGGIRSSDAITLTNSTVSGNTATRDGGGIRTSEGVITLTNSTVSGNTSGDEGGGIRSFSGDVTLSGSTITGNSAAAGGGVFVFDTNANPAFVVSNSIVAGNSATNSGPDLQLDPDSPLTVDFSLIGDTTDSGIDVNSGTGNLLNVDPMLGPLADNGGPTQTRALLPGSPALNAADPTAVAGQNGVLLFDQRGTGFDRVVGGRMDMGALEQQVPSCDFDGDFACDVDDIDALVMEIVAGTNNPLFDLTNDGNVDLADRDQWLVDAGAMNLPSGNAYLLGDANLDGVVDGQDFLTWNANKFQSTGRWSQADWNADGVTDGRDFLIWNSNKFQPSDAPLGHRPTMTLDATRARHIDSIFASYHDEESEERLSVELVP